MPTGPRAARTQAISLDAVGVTPSPECPAPQLGGSVALHRHPAWQETFLVLEGRFDFHAAGEQRSLGAGELIVIPRGAPHGYACTSPEPGRLLTLSDPARVFESFVAETRAANEDPTIDIRAVFAKHGLELL